MGALKAESAAAKGSRFYFVAGTLEVFSVNTKNGRDALASVGAKCFMKNYVSGHDMMMWKLGFAGAVQEFFPTKK